MNGNCHAKQAADTCPQVVCFEWSLAMILGENRVVRLVLADFSQGWWFSASFP
jgi:hypothetical protein